jgi:hypothetical protein
MMIMTNWLHVKFLRSLYDHVMQLYTYLIKVGIVSLSSKSVLYLHTNCPCVMEQDWNTVLLCPTDYNGCLTLHSVIT